MDFLLRGYGLAQPLNDYEFSGGRSFRVFEGTEGLGYLFSDYLEHS
jgi:hypothetical protein